MSVSSQNLYDLLPAIYRLRDSENNEVLKSYLAVFAEQIEVIQENIDQLYDDQFIETCAEWAVPYIGDLIAYKTLYNSGTKALSQRAEVANTIAYRRRKGTAMVLEQLARDVTGWPARAVEFFELIATTQYMNHTRSHNHFSPDLRDWLALKNIDTAFDSIAHTVDVRHIDTDRGRHNIKNIGLYLWRLQSYSLSKSPLLPIEPGHYYFAALQHDLPLFNKPVPEEKITHLAEPMNVPEPINRRVMHADPELFYGEGKSLVIYNDFDAGNDSFTSVPMTDIKVCCLADNEGNWINDPVDSDIALDPETGRISLGSDLIANPPNLWATFHYGFSAEIGGGEYQRGEQFDNEIGGGVETVANPQTIQAALDNLAGEGVVEITDTGRYTETLAINVNASTRIEIRSTNAHRPVILLDDELIITGGEDGGFTLDGLVIAGARLRVPADASLRVLRLRNCTLVPGINLDQKGDPVNPGEASIVIESANVQLEIENCLVGGVRAAEGVEVSIHNSVIDANSSSAVAYAALDDVSAGGSLKITNTTIIGKLHTRVMQLASNCIFSSELAPVDSWMSPLLAEHKQMGCVRFSYVSLGSRLPRRYRCQPELAINQAIKEEEVNLSIKLTSIQKADISQRLSNRICPVFKESRYAQPAYMQLALSCAEEILKGADDESEMGVFHDLFQPQREINLRLRLNEYMRFGLEAGIFYQT